jgi:hypothetical protein
MTSPTPYSDDVFRAALRSEARRLVVRLEARGVTFRIHDGKVQARPTALVTADDKAALRTHAGDVRVLVARRPDWSDWWTKPMPAFDPAGAFGPGPEARKAVAS